MENIITVSELNEQIKNLLEAHFDFVWVEGEVSNLRRPASGHVYFTLKDEQSQIRAVIFRLWGYSPSRNSLKQFELEEGMAIVCKARLTLYQPRGEYQLVIDTIEPKGIGALQKAFEQLKARLQAEGFFDFAHKKPIPFLPERIGVITSTTGAVIKDILNITARRFPSVDILIAPVRVQGTEAPNEIIRAIEDLHVIGNVDVTILARGGGSLEDLAAFNDERVARAIFNSKIPIISAIGHETDFTIADFVSDLRAPTPSAAAELVVPDKEDLEADLAASYFRITNHHRRYLKRLLDNLSIFQQRIRDPKRKIADLYLSLDDRLERLKLNLDNQIVIKKHLLQNQEIRLRHKSPLLKIKDRQASLENFKKSMITNCMGMMEISKKQIESHMAVLHSLSPLSILKRGYSIVKSFPHGLIIKKAKAVLPGDFVDVKVLSGHFHATVTEIFEE
jgi:exodeoxyribonuclease VII large subunit